MEVLNDWVFRTMSERTARRIAWLVAGLTVGLVALMLFLSAGREEAFDTIIYGLLALAFSGMGALIVSTSPGNRIGWILLTMGVLTGIWESAEGWGYFAADHDLAGGAVGEWIILWSWIIDLSLIAVVFMLFPTGRLPSRRWRPWVWVLAAAVALALPGQALNAGLGSSFTSGENPVGVEGLPADALLYLGLALLVAAMLAGLASLVFRFRRAGHLERQQIKWIALAASLLVVAMTIAFFFWYESILSQFFLALALTGLPIAAGIAIFRHGLYDVDVVINRTLVYGALTATLALAYLGGVLLLQLALRPLTESSNLAIAVTTLGVAALFRPARARIQEVVDRRFYRRKYNAQQTLAAFSTRLRDEVDLAALHSELSGVVNETLQPAHVSLWLRAPEVGR
jgi:hypothetical protein